MTNFMTNTFTTSLNNNKKWEGTKNTSQNVLSLGMSICFLKMSTYFK